MGMFEAFCLLDLVCFALFLLFTGFTEKNVRNIEFSTGLLFVFFLLICFILGFLSGWWRSKGYLWKLTVRGMGERKCAFEGCNALEFRTSGYCLRHKNGTPLENRFSTTNTRVSPSTDSLPFSWQGIFIFLSIAVPIILFGNILTHEEPPGAIAPTGLLNIPCFCCSLLPLLIGASMKYIRE